MVGSNPNVSILIEGRVTLTGAEMGLDEDVDLAVVKLKSPWIVWKTLLLTNLEVVPPIAGYEDLFP